LLGQLGEVKIPTQIVLISIPYAYIPASISLVSHEIPRADPGIILLCLVIFGRYAVKDKTPRVYPWMNQRAHEAVVVVRTPAL